MPDGLDDLHVAGATAEVARLIGEFTFLLWDPQHRRLVAARDALGLRELFYLHRAGQFCIGSQLRMCLPDPALSDIGEEYVADFLATQTSFGEVTPFRAVRRLPAAHTLIVADGRVSISRFWDLAVPPIRRSRSARENQERFLAVFREAVSHCLDPSANVCAELSGGLDSSSIVCIAQDLLREKPGRAKDFSTVTLVWDETPQSDERRWSETVVDAYGLTNHKVRCDDLFFEGMSEAAQYRNEPHFGICSHPMLRAEGELLRAFGVDILLTGARAESVVLDDMTPPVHLAELLKRLRFFCLWATAPALATCHSSAVGEPGFLFRPETVAQSEFISSVQRRQGRPAPVGESGFRAAP